MTTTNSEAPGETTFATCSSVVVFGQWRSTPTGDWSEALVVAYSRHSGLSVYARHCPGRLGEREPKRHSWSEVRGVQGITTADGLIGALNECASTFGAELDWPTVVPSVARVNWAMAAAAALALAVPAPRVPLFAALREQRLVHRHDKVEVSVEWGYEVHTVSMPLATWNEICLGKAVQLKSRGAYEGETFAIRWSFDRTAADALAVEYGDDGATGFLGGIEAAMVRGPMPQSVDLSAALFAEGTRQLA